MQKNSLRKLKFFFLLILFFGTNIFDSIATEPKPKKQKTQNKKIEKKTTFFAKIGNKLLVVPPDKVLSLSSNPKTKIAVFDGNPFESIQFMEYLVQENCIQLFLPIFKKLIERDYPIRKILPTIVEHTPGFEETYKITRKWGTDEFYEIVEILKKKKTKQSTKNLYYLGYVFTLADNLEAKFFRKKKEHKDDRKIFRKILSFANIEPAYKKAKTKEKKGSIPWHPGLLPPFLRGPFTNTSPYPSLSPELLEKKEIFCPSPTNTEEQYNHLHDLSPRLPEHYNDHIKSETGKSVGFSEGDRRSR